MIVLISLVGDTDHRANHWIVAIFIAIELVSPDHGSIRPPSILLGILYAVFIGRVIHCILMGLNPYLISPDHLGTMSYDSEKTRMQIISINNKLKDKDES